MPVSANTLRIMIEAGLQGEQLLAVVAAVDRETSERQLADTAAERRLLNEWDGRRAR